jgi:hypothetical protein
MVFELLPKTCNFTQDLQALQLGSKSDYPSRSYCPFSSFFSLPGPKGHVRYCHYLASVVHPFLHFVPFHQQIWPPRAILVSDWLLFKKIFYWSKYQKEIIITLKNSSHLEWRVGLSDKILKGTHTGTIYARFGRYIDASCQVLLCGHMTCFSQYKYLHPINIVITRACDWLKQYMNIQFVIWGFRFMVFNATFNNISVILTPHLTDWHQKYPLLS